MSKATATAVTFERGLFLNFLSVVLNAIAMTISKFALAGVNSMLVTFVICLTSMLLSFVYGLQHGHHFTKEEFKLLVPIAFINGAAAVLLYSSISILDPVVVGMIGRFYVVFTTILAVFVLKERLAGKELGLITLVVIGTFLFVTPKDAKLPALHFWGLIMAFGYTFLFALANLFVKKSVHKTSSVTILFYNNVVASAVSFALFLLSDNPVAAIQDISARQLLFALMTAVVTFSGLVLFFNSFRFLSFKLSNLIRSTSPLFIAFVSWPFFPVDLSIRNLIGGLLVVLSVIVLSVMEKGKS